MNQRVQVGARFRLSATRSGSAQLHVRRALDGDTCRATGTSVQRACPNETRCFEGSPTVSVASQRARLRLRGLRLWATAFRERLLQPGQLAVLEPQSETVREGRGIRGQILPPGRSGSWLPRSRCPFGYRWLRTPLPEGEPILGTWAVGEESIPIRHQRHPLHFRTFRTRLWIVARSRLRVSASRRGRTLG